MRLLTAAALAASLSNALAQQVYLGFNSGATKDDRSVKKQADFEKEFQTAQKLQNSPGLFSSVRLYTNIQYGTTDTPIEAFPAAMKTNTNMLLGMWCSGTTNIDKELSALDKAIKQYGKNFTDLVIGISVGSEDLYRASADGERNKAGIGQPAETIIEFIDATRKAIKNTALAKTPVGHVDTWTAWANTSNKDVIDAVDFVGADIYPYYEDGKNINQTNDIANALPIWQAALNATESAAGSKPVWITETGWPSTGPKWNDAEPSDANAKTYWDQIGCGLFGRTNTWWYNLRDSNPDNKMKFGLDPELDGKPRFNLTCPAGSGAPASINKATSKAAVVGVSGLNAITLAASLGFAVAAWIV